MPRQIVFIVLINMSDNVVFLTAPFAKYFTKRTEFTDVLAVKKGKSCANCNDIKKTIYFSQILFRSFFGGKV